MVRFDAGGHQTEHQRWDIFQGNGRGFCLSDKAKKAKGNMSQGEEGGKKMELIEFKYFHCHGHYAKNYPQRKSRKKESTVAITGEALVS